MSARQSKAVVPAQTTGSSDPLNQIFRTLVESVTEVGICMLDAQGNIVTWNDGGERKTRYTRDEVLNRNFAMFFTPEALLTNTPKNELNAAVCAQRVEAEGWRVRKDDSRFWASTSLTAIRDPAGELLGFAHVMRDLTAQKAFEASQATLALELDDRMRERTGQLEALVDELKGKNEEIASLAARVSHDLKEKEILLREVYHRVKNNLQVVQSLLKMKSRAVQSDDARNAIETAVQRVHVMSMVHEYLYQVPDLAGLTLSAFLRDVVEGAIAAHSERPHRIKLQLEVDALQIPLDFAIPLGLLANELVSNCLKHGLGRGGIGGIFVSARIIDGALRFVVHDDGVGLPANFDLANCSSMGIKLAASLTHQLGGQLQFTSNGGCRAEADLTRLWSQPKPTSPAVPMVPASALWMDKAATSRRPSRSNARSLNSPPAFLA